MTLSNIYDNAFLRRQLKAFPFLYPKCFLVFSKQWIIRNYFHREFHYRVLNESFPVDTGRKLNVHKTFRRRPGRLLKVLCTFNLRPVSTGLIKVRFFKTEKKRPDCVNLWVKFLIYNAVLKVSRRKNSKIFYCGAFSSCVVDEKFIGVTLFQETFPVLKHSWLRP